MQRLKLMITDDLKVRSILDAEGPKHVPCLPRQLAETVMKVRSEAFGDFADLVQRLKTAGEWSEPGLVAGIEDFLILSEMRGSTSNYAKLENLWLDSSRLSEFDPVARALEISLYTRIMLESYSQRFTGTTPRVFVQSLLASRKLPTLGFVKADHMAELHESIKPQ